MVDKIKPIHSLISIATLFALGAVLFFTSQSVAAENVPLLSIKDIHDDEMLLDYTFLMADEVERVRGLEIGQDLGIEFMTVPDFAYYYYLKEREERDQEFQNAIRLFLYGFGADEEKWTDPDVAAIQSARVIAGLYEPEDESIIITGNASSLIELVGAMAKLYVNNEDERGTIYSSLVKILDDDDYAKALSARQILYHELVHAGQDWNYGLGWLRYLSKKEFDFFLAVKALVEGDATLSSLHYLCNFFGFGKAVSDDLIREFMETGGEAKKKSGASVVSPITLLDDPLGIFFSKVGEFSYEGGSKYAGWLYTQDSFRAIDETFEYPPATTRQVLHPGSDAYGDFDVDVYDFGASPVFESSSRISELLDVDNISIDTTMGEFGINSLLAAFGVYDFEADAAEGWAGDRIRMYVDDYMKVATFWVLSWESEEAAKRFYSAYRDVIADKCSDDPGSSVPGKKPLVSENFCGTQFMSCNGGRIAIAELPWRLYDDELAEIEAFLESVPFETMTAAELSEKLVEKYFTE